MARKIKPLKARRVFKRRLFFTMGLRPVRLFCEHCDKYIPTEIEWQCGHCDQQNGANSYYSFLNKCPQCKRAPQAVVCPRCGQLNYLDKHRVGSHLARIIIPASTQPAIPPPTREEVRRQNRE